MLWVFVKAYSILATYFAITLMSQAIQTQERRKQIGGMFRAYLWAMILSAFGGIVGYIVGDVLSALLATSGSGLLIASQVLHAFGFSNASYGIQAQGLTYLYQSQVFPYIFAIAGMGVGFGIGYFKGKDEDRAVVQSQSQ